ncbi:hypothetical protein SAMN04488005_1617 [Yoonia tamlensis]|uniref:Lipoprotein n=1 Tax=Yoonia tamlensis TaxID=390270 RepID=A0A1I6GGA7_9RHOB|nr:DUF6778 family protein [Yoonia tamlensis]SFR41209.1 hypothetical protein SAMN04488005_1617 [Yoonia tamlensis]
MIKRFFGIVLLIGAMAACAGPGSDPRPAVDRSYTLQSLNFTATPGLVVSEANNYYPQADIVWRGDAPGPRIAQIGAMFETAAARNTSVIRGDTPVTVDIQLIRFHGVTERTRGSIGGVYNIIFMMTVRDARTGAVIEPARRIVANLDAPGGSGAQALEAAGRTEKVEVTDFLTATLRNNLI